MCSKCNETLPAMQRGNHARFRCPKQGRMLEVLERQRQKTELLAAIASNPALRFSSFFPCPCGCGAQVGQVKGKRKKHYVDDLHYAKHRNLQRRLMAMNGGPSVAAPAEVKAQEDFTTERRLAEEIAPIVAKVETAQRLAESTPLVTGEASFRLWALCLGFSVDSAAGAT